MSGIAHIVRRFLTIFRFVLNIVAHNMEGKSKNLQNVCVGIFSQILDILLAHSIQFLIFISKIYISFFDRELGSGLRNGYFFLFFTIHFSIHLFIGLAIFHLIIGIFIFHFIIGLFIFPINYWNTYISI